MPIIKVMQIHFNEYNVTSTMSLRPDIDDSSSSLTIVFSVYKSGANSVNKTDHLTNSKYKYICHALRT